MLYLEIKYLNLISPTLRNFKKKNNTLWNFSCPFCGDSQNNKLKARGYAFQNKGSLFFKCHNCDCSSSFSFFLKQLNPYLYREFIGERFGKKEEKPKQKLTDFFNKKEKVSEPRLVVNLDTCILYNPGRDYLENRKIPEEQFGNIYYSEDIENWINTKKKIFEKPGKCKAVVLPIYDADKILIGFQSRYIDHPFKRYVTTRLVEDSDLVYGMERLDFSKRIYIVEGPFDSLFLPNCIALRSCTVKIPTKVLETNNFTVILDNEPRGKEIIKIIDNMIKIDYTVCIWDERKEKDINDMILSGSTPDSIIEFIDNNSYSGLLAKINLNNWKRC